MKGNSYGHDQLCRITKSSMVSQQATCSNSDSPCPQGCQENAACVGYPCWYLVNFYGYTINQLQQAGCDCGCSTAHSSSSDSVLLRDDLLLVYGGLGGEEWLWSTNWGGGVSYCSWRGVVCANATSTLVVGLFLPSNNLQGNLSLSTHSFLSHSKDSLSKFQLSFNLLYGHMPYSISLLSALTTFLLEYNDMTGMSACCILLVYRDHCNSVEII